MDATGLIVAAGLVGVAGVILAVIGWRQRRTGFKVAAVLALPVALALVALWLFARVLSYGLLGANEPQPVPCATAASFIDQPGLPSGATETNCTHDGFQDSIYTIDFVVDSPALQLWLNSLPGQPQLTKSGCAAGADLCIDQVAFVPRAHGGADYVDLIATLRADGKLAVHLTALNT